MGAVSERSEAFAVDVDLIRQRFLDLDAPRLALLLGSE